MRQFNRVDLNSNAGIVGGVYNASGGFAHVYRQPAEGGVVSCGES